jgi:hypothetical protein
MIDRCFNSACKKRLRYLRDGRVVRVLRSRNGQLRVEHFWLCGPCYTVYDFVFSQEGTPSLKSRLSNAFEHLHENSAA